MTSSRRIPTTSTGVLFICETLSILSPGLNEFSLQTGPPEMISTISTSWFLFVSLAPIPSNFPDMF